MQPNSTLPGAALTALVLSVLTSGCTSDLPFDWSQVAPAPELSAAPSAESPSDPCDRPAAGATLFDLELNGTAETILLSDDRIVAASEYGWALWDKATARLIKNGGEHHGVDLVGDTLLTNGSEAFTLWDARDGSQRVVVATPDLTDRARLSHDGSYVFMHWSDAVTAWDRTGKNLLTHAIDASDDGVFAAQGELRVARDDVRRIDTIAIDSREVRTSTPYEGRFAVWFVDGTHFITTGADGSSGAPALRVYTKDATLVHSMPWINPGRWDVGGENGHFWVTDYVDGRFRVSVYRLGQEAPVKTLDDYFPSRPGRSTTTLLTHPKGGMPQLLNLQGEVPTLTEKALPEPTPFIITDEAGRWFFPGRGVVLEGGRGTSREPRRAFGCGGAATIAGGGERLAIATGHGVTRLYSFRGGQPKLVWKHASVEVSGLAFMGDGRYLVVRSREQGDPLSARLTVHIYEFDQEDRLVREVRHPVDTSLSYGPLSAAMSGTRYTQLMCTGMKFAVTCERRIMDLEGAPPWRLDERLSATSPAAVSPSGAFLAVETYRGGREPTFAIYQDGSIVRELSGSRPMLWLSDDRLLVDAQGSQRIIDLTGAVIAELAAPIDEVVGKHGVGVFHDEKSVYRDRDGKLLWSAGRPTHPWKPRATVGSRFVYVDDNTVRVESFSAALTGDDSTLLQN